MKGSLEVLSEEDVALTVYNSRSSYFLLLVTKCLAETMCQKEGRLVHSGVLVHDYLVPYTWA